VIQFSHFFYYACFVNANWLYRVWRTVERRLYKANFEYAFWLSRDFSNQCEYRSLDDCPI